MDTSPLLQTPIDPGTPPVHSRRLSWLAILLILLIILVVVGWRWQVNERRTGEGPVLTEELHQQILNLLGDAGSAPSLESGDRAQVEENLAGDGPSGVTISNEARNQILESLTQ